MTETKENANGPKWPGPVTFNDDDPKKGYSTLFLSVPELSVNKAMFGLRKSTAKNAEIKPQFTSESVTVVIKVQKSDGGNISYEYKKPLPEDIDPDKCGLKVKNGLVVVSLCKKSGLSWQQHSKYLIKRDEH